MYGGSVRHLKKLWGKNTIMILRNKHQLNYPKVQNKNKRCENDLFECCFTSDYTKNKLQFSIFINTKCLQDHQYILLSL